jgi:hypothetical protein
MCEEVVEKFIIYNKRNTMDMEYLMNFIENQNSVKLTFNTSMETMNKYTCR